MSRQQAVRLGRRGRPRVKKPPDPAELSIKLHQRAKEAAEYYRKQKIRAIRNGRIRNPLEPTAWPADVRKTWDDTGIAWQKWFKHGRSARLLLTGESKEPIHAVLRFPGGTYEVSTGESRAAQLFDVWFTYFVGQMGSASNHWTMMRVGFLYEFGDLLDPRVERSYKSLAKRFKKPTTTIQSYIRRYRKITSARSIS